MINNLEVREKMESKRIKYYEVAKVLGITPFTFSVWLRKELTPEKKEKVMKAIDEVTY